MKKIVLTPRGFSSIPIEAEVISPDNFAGKTIPEIRELEIYFGNRAYPMKEYIHAQGEVAETPEDQMIVIDGDARQIKHIGEGMTAGGIVIQGGAGMHTGAQMKGVPGSAAWIRHSIAKISQLHRITIEIMLPGPVPPIKGIGMTAIGISHPISSR